MTDVILVGGGLANSLIAYRLAMARPDLSLCVLEQGTRLGGESHTWSFHTGDVTASQRTWLAPFVVKSWPSYRVAFPGLDRTLGGGYHSITSERLHAVVAPALGDRVQFGAAVAAVAPSRVTVGDVVHEASCVIDGRGFPRAHPLTVGWQKFLGQRLRLARPHGLDGPVLMDATVPQDDGFRFFYLLPWDDSTLLVEDTRYSDTAALDRDHLRAEIGRYAAARGWTIREVTAEEEGILPIPLGGSIESFLDQGTRGVPGAGTRAALFHATTGYSFPEAVRLADELAAMPTLESVPLAAWMRRRSLETWKRGAFFRFLNRMLFRAAAPDRRFRVLEHFYRLPEETIHRFYSGTLTALDRIRLLSGKPPVPIGRAARCVFESTIPA